jgi:predicted dehydrogenase
MRFWPGWSFLKEIVDKQPYGRILAARFRRVSEKPTWSKQGTYTANTDLGGALFDLHIHDTDFVQFLFGRPTAVFSTGVTGSGGVIDHVFTQYHYPSGPAVEAEGGWLLAGGFTMAYTLYCERATLDYDMARSADTVQITEEGKPARTERCTGDGYNGEVGYIVDCIRKGTPPSVVTLNDGVVALEICEAEEASVRNGKPVAL